MLTIYPLTAAEAAAISGDADGSVAAIMGEIQTAALANHWSINVAYMSEETFDVLRSLGYEVVRHDPESRCTVSWRGW